ncbi:MAG: hypothetical protein M3P51_14720 [Chloroflexota bacterium]|nr:hypothetical protein [Chloroflexota bacterium]
MPKYRFPDEEPINEGFAPRRHWPEYSGREELREMDEIYGDLEGYHSGMWGFLDRVWNGERIRPCELQPYPELRARIQKVIAEGSPAASMDAAKYLEYLDELEKQVDLARKHVMRCTQADEPEKSHPKRALKRPKKRRR